MRITFGMIKTAAARVLTLPPTDTRVAEYVSRAQERLLYEGTWLGSYAKYAVCIHESCVTWPREIETIESYAICKVPRSIRNQWYEFLQSGPGIMSETCGNGYELIDRGEACCYDDPLGGSTKRYKLWASVTELTTLDPLIVQGYDSSGNEVRTQDSNGNWIDGEELAIPGAGLYTTGVKSIARNGLIRVIKPKTYGELRLYEYDTSALTYRQLAVYAHDETIPVYRRSFIPGLTAAAQSSDCGYKTVEIIAKRRHYPVVNDNDFLILSNHDALVLECQSIRKEENNLFDDAAKYHARAIHLLDKQLRHYLGNAPEHPIQMEGADVWGAGVENVM